MLPQNKRTYYSFIDEMRRLQLFILFLLFACTSQLYAQYVVFKCFGNVTIRKVGGNWEKIKKGQSLQLRDSLCVKEGCQLQILNESTSQIFGSVAYGKQTVLSYLNAARKQSGKVITELNQEIRQNYQESSRTSSVHVGASFRGDDDTYTDSLYSFVCVHFNQLTENSSGLKIRPVKSKRLFYFEVSNLSDKDYYINLVSYDKSKGTFSCVYFIDSYVSEFPQLISFHGQVQKLDFIFKKSSNVSWYLLASERSFDSNHLQKLMQSHVNYKDMPQAENAFLLPIEIIF